MLPNKHRLSNITKVIVTTRKNRGVNETGPNSTFNFKLYI
jgi:hypothetical protein